MERKKPREKRDLVSEVRKKLDAAYTADEANRREAISDIQFVLGHQWRDEDARLKEAAGLPMLTFNRLRQFVNVVANEIRLNPPSINVTPGDGKASKEVADVYAGIFRQIQRRSRASTVYANAARAAITCGIGHFRVSTQYVNHMSFDQEIVIEPILDPLSVFWDPDALKQDRSDAKYCIIVSCMTNEAFKEEYPGMSASDAEIPRPVGVDNARYWTSPDITWLAEYWYKKPKKRTVALLSDGRTVDMTDIDATEFGQLGAQIVRQEDRMDHVVCRALVNGTNVLEDAVEWPGRYIPIIPIIADETWNVDAPVRSGLVRDSKDAQRLYNFARTARAEIMGQAPRAPWLVTPMMIARHKSQWDSANNPNTPYLMYDPDPDAPQGRPIREAPPSLGSVYIEEIQLADMEMQKLTGVYDSHVGARSNETSGVAIQTRELQGERATLHYQDNLLASLHHLAELLLDLVPKIYDSEREITILDPASNEQRIRINQTVIDAQGRTTLVNDLTQGSYSVRAIMGPDYVTRRQEAAQSMIEFATRVPGAAGVIGDLIAGNMAWPGADEIADRLRKMLPPSLQPEPEDEDERAARAKAQAEAQAKELLGEKLAQINARLDLLLKAAQIVKTESEAGGSQPQSPNRTPTEIELDERIKEQRLLHQQASADAARMLTQERALDVQRKLRETLGQSPFPLAGR